MMSIVKLSRWIKMLGWHSIQLTHIRLGWNNTMYWFLIKQTLLNRHRQEKERWNIKRRKRKQSNQQHLSKISAFELEKEKMIQQNRGRSLRKDLSLWMGSEAERSQFFHENVLVQQHKWQEHLFKHIFASKHTIATLSVALH